MDQSISQSIKTWMNEDQSQKYDDHTEQAEGGKERKEGIKGKE